MRYSRESFGKLEETTRARSSGVSASTHADFVKRIERGTAATDRVAGVLLVGGRSPGDLAVRRAQSCLRFDHEPSAWSHAALILDWPDGGDGDRIVGVEVALFGSPFAGQCPERNGVEVFRLSKYLDQGSFPNLAFGTLKVGKNDDRLPKAKAAIVEAALNPLRDVVRYPLYSWLGPWRHFVHVGGESPIAQRAAHPGAAFCDYAYGAGGMDLSPGATDPASCPESIWATWNHWRTAVDPDGKSFVGFVVRGDRECRARDGAVPSLDEDFKKVAIARTALSAPTASSPRPRGRRSPKSKGKRN